jgi:TctA family transporter
VIRSWLAFPLFAFFGTVIGVTVGMLVHNAIVMLLPRDQWLRALSSFLFAPTGVIGLVVGICTAAVYLHRVSGTLDGRCCTCSYDLRESTDICPECGTPIEAKE